MKRRIHVNHLYKSIHKCLLKHFSSLQTGELVYAEKIAKELQDSDLFRDKKLTTILGLITRYFKGSKESVPEFEFIERLELRMCAAGGQTNKYHNVTAYRNIKGLVCSYPLKYYIVGQYSDD
jgi:hypothetical protein